MSSDVCLNSRRPSVCPPKAYQTESSSTVYTDKNEKIPGHGISSYEDPALTELFKAKDPAVIRNYLGECYNGALSSLKKAPYDPCINLDILLQCAYHSSVDVRIAAGQYLARLDENLQLRDRLAEDVVRTMCVLDCEINAKASSTNYSQSGPSNSPGRDPVPPVQFMQIVKNCLDDECKNIAWERLKDLSVVRPLILKECRWIAKFRLNFNCCPGPDDILPDTSSSSLSGSVIRQNTEDRDDHDVEEKSFCPIHSLDKNLQDLMDSIDQEYTKFVNDTHDQLDLNDKLEQNLDLDCSSEKYSVIIENNNIQTKGNSEPTVEKLPTIKVVHLPKSSIIERDDETSGMILDKKNYMKEKIKKLRQNKQPIEKIIQESINNNLNSGSCLPESQEKIEQKNSSKFPPPPPPPLPMRLNMPPPPPPPPESLELETVKTVSKTDPDYLKKLIEQRSVHRSRTKRNRRATDPADKARSNVDGKQERSLTVPERTTGKSPGSSRLSSINESGSVEGNDLTSKTLETNTVGTKVKRAFKKFILRKKT